MIAEAEVHMKTILILLTLMSLLVSCGSGANRQPDGSSALGTSNNADTGTIAELRTDTDSFTRSERAI